MKNIKFYIPLVIILSSCAGSGLKDYNDYISSNNMSLDNKVVIYRQSGFVGAGTIFTIVLNGSVIGKIGNQEFVVGEMQEGRNYINVKVDGLQGVGLNQPKETFTKTTNKNLYFKVGYTGLDAQIFIQEISAEEFKKFTSN